MVAQGNQMNWAGGQSAYGAGLIRQDMARALSPGGAPARLPRQLAPPPIPFDDARLALGRRSQSRRKPKFSWGEEGRQWE